MKDEVNDKLNDKEIDSLLKKAAGAPYALKPETLQRVSDSIKPSLRPVRPLPPTWMLTGAMVLVCAAISLAGAARAGFFGFKEMDLLQRSLIYSTLAILAVVAATRFVHEMIPATPRRLSPTALWGMTCVVLLGVFALLFRGYHTEHFISVGIVCLLTGLLHAVPAALLGWLLLRRGFALDPVSAGFAAGVLGGLAGVGMLELHCPNLQAVHILVWHTAVVPLSGAVGAMVGALVRSRLRLRRGSGHRHSAPPN